MEGAGEGDEPMPARVVTRQLERRFHGLGSGVTEVDAPRRPVWRDGSQLLGQLHHVGVVEIGSGHVDQPCGLLLDGIYDTRMAVAGSHHGNSGIAIEKMIAIHVDYDGAFAPLHDERIAASV